MTAKHTRRRHVTRRVDDRRETPQTLGLAGLSGSVMSLIKPGTRRKRGPSQTIVRLASAPSRRFALLRPRCRAANGLDRAVRQPHAAIIIDGPHEQCPIDTHGIREPLDDAHRRRYCEVIFCRLRIATPSASPDAEHTDRRPQVTVRLFSRHTLWLLIRVTIRQRITQSRRISFWPKVTVRDPATRRSRTYSTRAARTSPIFNPEIVTLPRPIACQLPMRSEPHSVLPNHSRTST